MAVISSPRSLDRSTKTPTQTRGNSWTSVVASALKAPLADYYLLVCSVVVLCVLGMAMVFSSSSVIASVFFDTPYYFLLRQGAFLVVGGVVAWWLSRRSLLFLQRASWWGAALSLGLLMLIFVPGIGFEVAGNRNWINLHVAGLSMQPSEFAKIAIAVWGSAVMAAKYKVLDQPNQMLVPLLPVSLVMIALVVLGKDLGTAMVMVAILFGLLWIVGTSWKLLVPTLLAGALGVAVLVKTSSNRMQRLFSFLTPQVDDPREDQSIQALYAFASGGWWGRGLGRSTQKWGVLPQAHTDYIFAIVGEELGLLGSIFTLGLFAVLAFAGFRVALRSDQPFARYCAGAITLWFSMQALMNIMVVLRWGPVLGVPLPFLSYGGSSLLAAVVATGFLLACARQEPAARAALSARKGAGRPTLISVVDSRRR